MSFFKSKPQRFSTVGKDKFQLTIDAIVDFDEGPYAIAAGEHNFNDDEIDAGYSVTIWAKTTCYWRNEQKVEVEELRVSVKINSDPARHRVERGVFGGGVFHSKESLEVELNVEPRCVKDIMDELRRDKKRGIRIDGYAISDNVFRVAYFLLFPSEQ